MYVNLLWWLAQMTPICKKLITYPRYEGHCPIKAPKRVVPSDSFSRWGTPISMTRSVIAIAHAIDTESLYQVVDVEYHALDKRMLLVLPSSRRKATVKFAPTIPSESRMASSWRSVRLRVEGQRAWALE